jgi:hypothetical protein
VILSKKWNVEGSKYLISNFITEPWK